MTEQLRYIPGEPRSFSGKYSGLYSLRKRRQIHIATDRVLCLLFFMVSLRFGFDID